MSASGPTRSHHSHRCTLLCFALLDNQKPARLLQDNAYIFEMICTQLIPTVGPRVVRLFYVRQTYPHETIHPAAKRLRQSEIQNVYVFRKAVQQSSDRGDVEKLHRRMDSVREQLDVEQTCSVQHSHREDDVRHEREANCNVTSQQVGQTTLISTYLTVVCKKTAIGRDQRMMIMKNKHRERTAEHRIKTKERSWLGLRKRGKLTLQVLTCTSTRGYSETMSLLGLKIYSIQYLRQYNIREYICTFNTMSKPFERVDNLILDSNLYSNGKLENSGVNS